MPNYSIEAKVTKHYNIEGEFASEEEALASLDEFIEEDFEPFKQHAIWDIEIKEN